MSRWRPPRGVSEWGDRGRDMGVRGEGWPFVSSPQKCFHFYFINKEWNSGRARNEGCGQHPRADPAPREVRRAASGTRETLQLLHSSSGGALTSNKYIALYS